KRLSRHKPLASSLFIPRPLDTARLRRCTGYALAPKVISQHPPPVPSPDRTRCPASRAIFVIAPFRPPPAETRFTKESPGGRLKAREFFSKKVAFPLDDRNSRPI